MDETTRMIADWSSVDTRRALAVASNRASSSVRFRSVMSRKKIDSPVWSGYACTECQKSSPGNT